MSVQLDPIIAEKLEDFRRRRRNLIILRGICTAIVTLLGVFSTIAIADYLSQARMPDELRTTLSYAGYAVVVLAVPLVGVAAALVVVVVVVVVQSLAKIDLAQHFHGCIGAIAHVH